MAFTNKEKRAIKKIVSTICELHRCYRRADIDSVLKDWSLGDRIDILYMAIPRPFDSKKDKTLDDETEYELAIGAFLNADVFRKEAPVDFLTDYVIQDFYSRGIDRLFKNDKDR
jgi:hypothetical protein